MSYVESDREGARLKTYHGSRRLSQKLYGQDRARGRASACEGSRPRVEKVVVLAVLASVDF